MRGAGNPLLCAAGRSKAIGLGRGEPTLPSPTSEESNSRTPREETSLYFETIGGLLVAGTCFRQPGKGG